MREYKPAPVLANFSSSPLRVPVNFLQRGLTAGKKAVRLGPAGTEEQLTEIDKVLFLSTIF